MKYKCIDQWLATGERFSEIIKDCDERSIPIIQFMQRSFKKEEAVSDFKKINQEANEIIDNFDRNSGDIRAYFLFLEYWLRLAYGSGKIKEALAIFNRLMAINAKEIPKEFLPLRIRLKGIMFGSINGDMNYYEKCLKEALDLLPDSSKLKYISLSQYMIFLAESYRYVEIQDKVESYLKSNCCPTHFKDYVCIAEMSHYFSTYQVSEGHKLLKKFNKNFFGTGAVIEVDNLQHFASKAENDFIRSEKLPIPDLNLNYSHNELIDISNSFLATNKAPQGLRWARKIMKDYGISLNSIGFNTYILIRAELANKNERSSRLQLLEKSNRGGASFLDDFFWARVELLAGHFDLAIRYFKKVLESCEYYDAVNVLENEIKLSTELKPADLFKLYQGIKEINPKSLPKLKTKSSKKHVGQKIIGESQATQILKKEVKKFAKLNTSILIMGETGVGKDVVARVLHEESDRAKEPFIAINCGAINESLLQSELFGHVAGAYTGAEKSHKGIFEAAGNGTVFLDEIGEISPALQVALLRVLEAGEIRPVGSARSKPYKARVLAATNAPLEMLVDKGSFRQDLFYRLNKLVLQIKPLRERPSDITPLAKYFFQEDSLDGEVPVLSDRLIKSFEEFSWPGNVRELKNEVERMRLLNSEKLEYDLEDSYLLKKHKNVIKENKLKVVNQDKSKRLEAYRSERKTNTRIEEIKELFEKYKTLTRNEMANVMDISLPTASRDLKKLLKEGFIEKIEPTLSPRTHYFILKL